MTATANDSSLANKLEEIVGERFVMKRESDLLVYNSDGLPGYRRMPRIAVFPGNRDEAVAVVRVLAAEKRAFVPRGAGTGLSGGALADDIVLLGQVLVRGDMRFSNAAADNSDA